MLHETPPDRTASASKAKATRRVTAPRAPTLRSRVGNGKEVISGLNKNSAEYREYLDAVIDLEQHLGGDPSVVERAIAEEAAGLIIWTRRARKALIEGGEGFDIASYTTATNALRRLLADIGQQARLRDVTPSLAEFVTRRAAEHREAAE